MEVAAPGMDMLDLRIAELVCSRICHDLVNPLNSISAGLEMIQSRDAGVDPVEAAALAGRSADTLSRRLTFLRAALGRGGLGAGGVAMTELRRLSHTYLAVSLVDLDWHAGQPETIPAEQGRLLLNIVMLASETLLRGGTLTVDTAILDEGLGFALKAQGPGVRFHDGVLDAIRNPSIEGLTPRTVQAYYSARLAERLGSTIEISSSESDSLEMACLLPA